MQDSVTIAIDAPPERVWALVSDVTSIGRYSPETFEAEWLDGATGPAVGARFRGHVRRNGRGPVYWTSCVVTVCEPGREFTFTVGEGDKALNTWGYRLEPDGTGTDATEFFRLKDNAPLRLYWRVFGRWRGRTNREGMRRTLEGVKRVAEADAHGGDDGSAPGG